MKTLKEKIDSGIMVSEQIKACDFCLENGKYTISKDYFESILKTMYSQGVTDGVGRIIEIINGEEVEMPESQENYLPDERQMEIENANQSLT